MLKDTHHEETAHVETVPPEIKRKRYTLAERQRIRDAFAKAHGGVFDPKLFVEEAEDPDHEAHDWFDWDDASASYQWRLTQARAFNRGLTKIKIVISHSDLGDVRHRVSIPSMISPLAERRNGGGYVVAQEDELIRQALRDLKGQAIRHRAALIAANVNDDMNRVLVGLETAAKT